MMPSVMLYADFTRDRLGASYERAFLALGCDVTRCDTREMTRYLAPWLSSRAGHRATYRSLRLRAAGSTAWNRYVQQTAARTRAELVVVVNGELLMPDTIACLRETGSRVFILHADNPFPPHAGWRPEALPSALLADCYLIWSRRLRQRLLDHGVRRVEYLPFAWDEAVFPVSPPSASTAHDVVFIGGWDRGREAFLDAVSRHVPVRIWGPIYWGTRTQSNSPSRRCWQGSSVTEGEAASIIAGARLSLNIVRTQNLPDGTNMRTFEVPGCGGLSLATRTSGATDILPEGLAGAYFGTADECCEQIDRLLRDSALRASMAGEAHRIVAEKHTYVHRAQQILDLYADGEREPSPASAVHAS